MLWSCYGVDISHGKGEGLTVDKKQKLCNGTPKKLRHLDAKLTDPFDRFRWKIRSLGTTDDQRFFMDY